MFSAVTTQIDVRETAPRNRHALIFEAFDALKAGEALELLNDHDPAPLRQQLIPDCVDVFPVNAIYAAEDVPGEQQDFMLLNAKLARMWKPITKLAMPDADA